MKKVLSFVLVLSLVLSSFSMAFAGVGEKEINKLSDIAGNANEEAIQVVNDLGIVTGYEDGTFKADKAVKRAEFAVMITKALGIPESALAGYTVTNFTDVEGYDWAVPYLAFCESKGIMSGYGEGIVKPGNTITINEAVTMVLRAVGYTPNAAELVGTWPANYVTKAQDCNLYDDVKAVNVVDRASAAQIIYNTLTVGKVQVDADGQVTSVLGADLDGDGNADQVNMLTGGLNCTPAFLGYVVVDETCLDNSLIDMTKYLGAYGTVYQNSDNEIVAFDRFECTTLTGEVDGNDFVVGDTTYKVKSGVTIDQIIENAADVPSVSGGSIVAGTATASALGTLEAYSAADLTINAKVVGRTISQIYSVNVWTLSDADFADENVQDYIADDNELLGYAFAEDNNGDIDAAQFALVGVKSLTDIEEDDVVYVFSKNGAIRLVVVGQTTVEGKITKVDGTSLYINGKWYDASDAAADPDGNTVGSSELGNEYKLYLDAYGDYFYAEKISGSVATFGVVKGFDNEDAFDSTRIKMYTSLDSTKTYTFADDNDSIDYLQNGSYADYNVISAGAFVTATTVGALVGYELDADGNLDTLDVGVVQKAAGSVAVTLKSTKVLNVAGTGDLVVNPNVVVFTYGANKTTDLDMIKISEVKLGANLTSGAAFDYITNEDGEVVAMLMNNNAAFTDKDTDEVYGIFHAVVDTQNADDEDINEFTGFIGTKEGEYLTEDDTYKAVDTSQIGALYEIKLTADGTIESMTSLLGQACSLNTQSGYIVTGATITAGGIAESGTLLTDNAGNKYTVDADAIVYEATLDHKGQLDVYKTSNLGKLKMGYEIYLFDTQGTDCDGIADVVVFVER